MEDIEIKERILNKASEMFYQYGFTKVTMEEIASALGISKKTLYKFYPGKEAVLRGMFEHVKCEVDDYISRLWADQDMDFVLKLKNLMDFIGKQSCKLRGPLIEDIQKNHPAMWQEFQEFRRQGAHAKFSMLIKDGIEKGVFNKDIDQQLVTLFYINAVQGIIVPDVLAQLPYTTNQIFEALAKIVFEGILSEEGRLKYQRELEKVE